MPFDSQRGFLMPPESLDSRLMSFRSRAYARLCMLQRRLVHISGVDALRSKIHPPVRNNTTGHITTINHTSVLSGIYRWKFERDRPLAMMTRWSERVNDGMDGQESASPLSPRSAVSRIRDLINYCEASFPLPVISDYTTGRHCVFTHGRGK